MSVDSFIQKNKLPLRMRVVASRLTLAAVLVVGDLQIGQDAFRCCQWLHRFPVAHAALIVD